MAEVKIDLLNQFLKSEAFRDFVQREKIMTDLNYGEMATCELAENRPETAKAILENMDSILKELSNELRRIDDAIYSPKNVENSKDLNEPKQECFLGTLNRQRDVAEKLLHLAVHIREGLW